MLPDHKYILIITSKYVIFFQSILKPLIFQIFAMHVSKCGDQVLGLVVSNNNNNNRKNLGYYSSLLVVTPTYTHAWSG